MPPSSEHSPVRTRRFPAATVRLVARRPSSFTSGPMRRTPWRTYRTDSWFPPPEPPMGRFSSDTTSTGIAQCSEMVVARSTSTAREHAVFTTVACLRRLGWCPTGRRLPTGQSSGASPGAVSPGSEALVQAAGWLDGHREALIVTGAVSDPTRVAVSAVRLHRLFLDGEPTVDEVIEALRPF